MSDAAITSAPDACPVCGGAGSRWLEKRGYQLLRCDSCGTGYLPHGALPEDPAALYSSAYFEGETDHGYPTYRKDAGLALRNFDERLEWIEALHPPGRILEVGAAYGFFLEAARRRGWHAEGVEIAPDCAAEAERLSGARVTAGNFLEVQLDGKFEVVCMFDVIEHLADPLAALRRARSLLSEGGLVVVETGNGSSPWARLLGPRWYFIDPPQHVVYFNAESLGATLRRAGFEGAIHTGCLGRRVSFANVAFKLLGRRAASLPVPGSAYLNFGDSVLVAAAR